MAVALRSDFGRSSTHLSLIALLLIGFLGVGVSAASAEAPEFLDSFGPDGSTASNFEEAASVAVSEQTGEVYVLDKKAGSLYRFDEQGHPITFSGSAGYISGNQITGLAPFAGKGASQVAVSGVDGTIYVTEQHSLRAFDETGEPAEFTAGPDSGTSELSGFGEVFGAAVDAEGNIYVSDREGEVASFTASGEPITQFAVSNPANLAVGPDGSVYVNRWGGTVLRFTPSEQPVTPITTFTPAAQPLDEKETFGVSVDPETGNVYLVQLFPSDFTFSHVVVYDKNGTFIETFADPGEEGELFNNSSGIAVHGASSRIYASTDDPIGETFSQVRIFGPEEICEGTPAIESVSAVGVAGDSSTVRGTINPCSADTSYRFEVGIADCSVSECMNIPLGGASIGSGHNGVVVSQLLTGLQSDTTYHYRLIASNEHGTIEGTDHTFRTQATKGAFELSDSRAWEMVSPPNKRGGILMGPGFGLVQAAANGHGISYPTLGSIEAEPEGNRSAELSSVLARREESGWVSKDITPPNTGVVPLAVGFQGEYNLFSPDLGRAMLEPRGSMPLSLQSSERTPYLRDNVEPPVYTPLVTDKEGFANVPPGTEFGGDPQKAIGKVRLVAANPDLTHVVLMSQVPFVAGAPEPPLPTLYEWSAGQLRPLSVLPSDEGGDIVTARWIGSGPGSVRHAISADGARIFWSPGNYGTSGNALTALYMRDTASEETVRLDVVQPGGSGSGEPRPVFQGANADGTVVFFTDSQQLTEGAGLKGRDLYRCEIPVQDPSGGCTTLTDITASTADPGESAEVLGLAPALSEDGSTIYFVARGILDPTQNGNGEGAAAERPNLYLWKVGESIRFIATLSEADEADWGASPGQTYRMSATGSSAGRYLAFASERSLTGYDNRDAASGNPVQEVFRYDAEADMLQCVSCNPTGGMPLGQSVGLEGRPLADPQNQWTNQWAAAILPDPTIMETAGVSLYHPRVVLDSGRVFFNSFDALVPADSNRQWDVYQYESYGVGSCSPTAGNTAIALSGDGCISLMSSGTGSAESGFLDASASGDDVFFLSPAKLSVEDEDDELDLYDARVGARPAVRELKPGCAGEACGEPSTAPSETTPASLAFIGPGNVKKGQRCPKGKRQVKKRGKTVCVKRRHQRRHHRAASKSRTVGR